MKLRIKKLHPDAVIPKYATAGAACFDLIAIDVPGGTYIAQNQSLTLRTGLAFEVPEGWVLKVYSRSGHGFNNGVRLCNSVGIIDSDYRGELMVRLTADYAGGLVITNGARVAQAMLVQAPKFELIEVDDLSDTARGTGGFGSTGA